ncbi:class C sortase [Enterococcus italicus]|uniref:class C sortase n=1 Tax=Enterococcus italicus TaxID=246144 RepID=UPI003F47996C
MRRKAKTNKATTDEKVNLFLKILMAFLFILGAIIFFYPFVVDAANNYFDQQRINYYITQTEKENKAKIEEQAEKLAAENAKMASEYTVPGMTDVKDPFADINNEADKPTKAYYQNHNIGAIFIPSIEVSLPLFDTTNDTLLAEGATVLQGSSYPIGGESTHSVITGHTGLPDKTLFTDLTDLKKGDMIYLHVLEKKLAYKIRSFKVVKPDELDDLKIVQGEDLITLVTCTPYMINTDRLLVTAERVPYKETSVEKTIKKTQNYHRWKLYAVMAGVGLFFAIFFAWVGRKIWLYRGSKRRYDVAFYLEEQGQAVSGQSVRLVQGFNKRPVRVASQQVEVASTASGLVQFTDVPGGNYRVQFVGEPKRWPKINVRLKKLSESQLAVKIKTADCRIEGKGSSSPSVYVKRRSNRQ